MLRLFALAAGLALLVTTPALGQTTGVVFKDPSCHCCIKWWEHMAKAGFVLQARDLSKGQIVREKVRLGLSIPLAACHTAEIGGYAIEGHVPADDVKRLLAEKPEAIGLAVPRMPLGSPGMEDGDAKEPYEVLLVKKDGSTEVFAKH